MKKTKSIYYKTNGIKFTIKIKNSHWHIEFYYEKRWRRSTGIKVSDEDIDYIKKRYIPENIIAFLDTEQTVQPISSDQTLDEYAQNFFELEKNRIRESSLEKDLKWYDKHIYPYFGERLLCTIKKTDLKNWQNNLINATNPKTDTKYKRGYIQNLRSVFNKILNEALEDELIEKNYFINIPTPRSLKNIDENQIEDEIKPFTPAQIRLILSKATGFLRNFILLMFATGMRPGEIVALEWNDIDWQREIITVNKTRARGKDGKPKTKNSYREIDIYTNAKNALIAQLELTEGKEKIFVNTIKGNAFASHAPISALFRKLLIELGIEGQYLYNLRHTFASVMIPIHEVRMIDVSQMMGHKDLSTTLKIYTRFIEQDEEVRIRRKRVIDGKIEVF